MTGDKDILRALRGEQPPAHVSEADPQGRSAVEAALHGEEWLYGLPVPPSDGQAVKRWAVIEGLHQAAGRHIIASSRGDADALVREAYGMTNPDAEPLDRIAQTSRLLNRFTEMREAL